MQAHDGRARAGWANRHQRIEGVGRKVRLDCGRPGARHQGVGPRERDRPDGVSADPDARATPPAAQRHPRTVLDVACGTGQISLPAAAAVGAEGSVLGVDLSERMVEAARKLAQRERVRNLEFARMDAATLALPDARFDVVLCSLGLMYLPDPAAGVREMHRVLRPGGRLVLSVWGERKRCGWAGLFEIVDAEVASEVCPLFFGLGGPGTLARLCREAGFEQITEQRRADTLVYADGDQACRAAFVGGPVALAWSRFSPEVQARVCARYLAGLASWRVGLGYRVPVEFVVVVAQRAATAADG